ncbi:MAG: CocE/NonD family hydrolase [Actinomycetota bacterium]
MGDEVVAERPGFAKNMLGKAASRMMGLPKTLGGFRVAKDLEVPTKDGSHLLTDHFAPDGEANAGTILVRSPYGRGFPNSLMYGRTFAGAGYHVLVQSVRGTFGSPGDFQPFEQEAADAQDTVSWLRGQPWFDGRLATLGGSYLGFAQWALLSDPPAELRAAVIVVGPHDMSRVLHGTGSFALAIGFGWSEAVATQEQFGHVRRLARMATVERRTRPAFEELPLADAAEPFLGGGATWYREWLAHTEPSDRYWDEGRADAALQQSKVPTLLIGGWHDAFLDQTIEQYETLKGRGVEVALTMGPWTHMQTATKAAGLITEQSLEWLDEYLGDREPVPLADPVRLFVTGAEEWRDYPDWPPATRDREYFLEKEGVLGASAGDGTTTFIFDPSDPTPVLGGRLLHPRHGGPKDNKKLEAREDVVTFTGAPLDADLDVIGRARVELSLSVDNSHADVFVRLCDVDQKGISRNFADALLRLDPRVAADEVQRITLELDPCAHRLKSGHRLRLQVSGGAHPRYARNLGTGEPLETGRTMAPSRHVVRHAGSRIILPIADPTG